jgi:histone acetyltransferase (RNA polymerase elongator complex component)
MSMHINRFIDNIKATEARGGRDVILSLRDAKDLHGDITKLLLTLETLRTQQQKQETIEVVVSGGTFKST